jgi:hypothetical protein
MFPLPYDEWMSGQEEIKPATNSPDPTKPIRTTPEKEKKKFFHL